MARKILLNYRRADSKGYAVAIYNSLVSNFGEDQIFMDIDAIEPGTDFVKVLEKAVLQCDVLIVLIGSQWLGIKDASGERRLDNKSDFVRIEIKAALEREVTVLPVLVQGAIMPSTAQLPDDIRSLARRQAFVISDRFSTDVEQLVEVLNKILERARRERIEKEKAEKKKKKTTKPLIKILSLVRKRPEKVPKSASEKAGLKPEVVEKVEKKKPSKPPKPAPIVQKQTEKVLEKPPVKTEVKTAAPRRAHAKKLSAQEKLVGKKHFNPRWLWGALGAVVVLVGGYLVLNHKEQPDVDLANMISEATASAAPAMPTATPFLGFDSTTVS